MTMTKVATFEKIRENYPLRLEPSGAGPQESPGTKLDGRVSWGRIKNLAFPNLLAGETNFFIWGMVRPLFHHYWPFK